MAIDLPPLHHALPFLAPLSDERASTLCDFLARTAAGTIVDAGCGWAELLLRALERAPDLRGIGIDLDEASIRVGREHAMARSLGDRVDLVAGDARTLIPDQAGAVICIGASQIWGPPVEDNQPIGYRAALDALRECLQPGMPAVFGEGIWVAAPTPAAIRPLAGRDDEFVDLHQLHNIARDCGFVIERSHQASLAEWDRFEAGFAAGYVDWLARNPDDHPEAEQILTRLATQADNYSNGYRGVLGMAYLELVAG